MKKNVFKLLLLLFLSFSAYGCSENDISKEANTTEQELINFGQSSSTARISLTDKLKLPAGIKDEGAIKWTESTGVVEILKSVNFSPKTAQADVDSDVTNFYWTVPDIVKKIIIKRNVKITGHFRLSNTIGIIGEDRGTCVIFGTATRNWAGGPDGIGQEDPNDCNKRLGDDRAADCEKWKFGGISGNKEGAIYTIKNLTIRNSRTYAVTSFNSKIVMNNVFIHNSRPQDGKGDFGSNSDGISGGKGTVVTNCKFDTWDDSIKLYKDMSVENVTIVQNSNGAAFQFGWGSKEASTHSLKNILITTNNVGYSNLTVFAAALTSGNIPATVDLGDFVVKIEDTQKFRNTTRPLPLFLSRSTGKVSVVINQTGENYNLIAPAGITKMNNSGNEIGGTFSVTGKICNYGFSTSALNINCGNSALVTGCGW